MKQLKITTFNELEDSYIYKTLIDNKISDTGKLTASFVNSTEPKYIFTKEIKRDIRGQGISQTIYAEDIKDNTKYIVAYIDLRNSNLSYIQERPDMKIECTDLNVEIQNEILLNYNKKFKVRISDKVYELIIARNTYVFKDKTLEDIKKELDTRQFFELNLVLNCILDKRLKNINECIENTLNHAKLNIETSLNNNILNIIVFNTLNQNEYNFDLNLTTLHISTKLEDMDMTTRIAYDILQQMTYETLTYK